MLKRWWWLCLVVVALTACQGGDAANSDSGQSAVDENSEVRWNRDPYNIVFRAEVTGGEDAFFRLNEVPPCTIYGDGRIVWVEEIPGSSVTRILFDYLNDQQIIGFVWAITIEGRFLTYTEEFPNQMPSSTTPVYEKMTLAVNDVTHVTDSFAGWPDGYYTQLLQQCRTLAVTPRLFEPEGAWLSAVSASYNSMLPSIFWDVEASGINLGAIASLHEKRWIEGGIVKALWRAVRDNMVDIQFEQGVEDVYQIALQVPGVTRDAPPAPQQ